MSDFLYDNPDLYDKIFSSSAGDVCIDVFQKHLSQAPVSILDIGCGTGRELSQLSKLYPDCVGFDVLPTMTSFAKKRNPHLTIFDGDMRTVRLNRTFDAIYAVGGTINFALSNEDLVKTIKTYQVHAHPDTLLLVEPINPNQLFGTFSLPGTFSVPYKGSMAHGEAHYELFKSEQIVKRTRTWDFGEQASKITESVRFRVIFPAELSYFLAQNGFDVIDVFEKPRNDIYTTAMYVVAMFIGSSDEQE